MFPPPSQNTVGICDQITLLILYYISSRLVTLLKVNDAPLQVANTIYLTISFKFHSALQLITIIKANKYILLY